ncbi:MAG TPA: hypothetical protein VM511_04510 [Luteolibacter sp.]|nr:hypothetical protein [Luteolibacter sp.]
MKSYLLVPLIVAVSALSSSGSILMLDFGATDVTLTPAMLTNSPYHTAAGAGFTDTSWNMVQTADVSVLKYSDGTAATGVSVNLGVAPNGSTTVNLATQPSTSSTLGTVINTGIYAAGSVGRDGVFGSTAGHSLGIQVTGLTAGTYDIYVVGRNTNNADTTASSYAFAGTAGNFDFSGGTPITISYVFLTEKNAWMNGVNYSRHTVVVPDGGALNIATTGGAGAETRGFMNSIQIVQQVPEPAVAALLIPGLLVLRRRRA